MLKYGRFLFHSFPVRRVSSSFKEALDRHAWRSLKSEMISFFKNRPVRDSTVYLNTKRWPAFVPKERILEEGFIPCKIEFYGDPKQLIIRKEDLQRVAFDDGPNGHLSHLFKGRLFKLKVDGEFEETVVSDYKAHPVNKELLFVKFGRHIKGVSSILEIPITLTGILGCPAQISGNQIELAVPKIKVKCPGPFVPPPILIDCSQLKPMQSITLNQIKNLLPRNCKIAMSQRNLKKIEVVSCYDHKQLEEKPLPLDYQDPNFIRPSGKKYHLTYTGFWPKQ
jgi:hypothetical protein